MLDRILEMFLGTAVWFVVLWMVSMSFFFMIVTIVEMADFCLVKGNRKGGRP